MINWKPIETMPSEMFDGREVLLWLRAPFSEAVVRKWDQAHEVWVEEFIEPDEDMHGAGMLVPSHFSEINPP